MFDGSFFGVLFVVVVFFEGGEFVGFVDFDVVEGFVGGLLEDVVVGVFCWFVEGDGGGGVDGVGWFVGELDELGEFVGVVVVGDEGCVVELGLRYWGGEVVVVDVEGWLFEGLEGWWWEFVGYCDCGRVLGSEGFCGLIWVWGCWGRWE